MRWSVMIWGAPKPDWALRDKKLGEIAGLYHDPPTLFSTENLELVNMGNERRIKPGDVTAFKPEHNWNVADDYEFNEIKKLLRSPKWIADYKDEVRELHNDDLPPHVKDTPRAKALFDSLWNTRIMRHGVYNPKFLPSVIRNKFCHLPCASMYHRTGHEVWTPNEKSVCLRVLMDVDNGVEGIHAAIEPEWDIESYSLVPEGVDVFSAPDKDREKNLVAFRNPQLPWRKRRFNLPLDVLRDMGVDIDKMKNRDVEYTPELDPINITKTQDKLKQRAASETDGFNRIKPRTDTEIKFPPKTEAVLANLRRS